MNKKHQNHSLFSDYYLEELLPGENEWKIDVREPFEELKKLWNSCKTEIPNYNESQLRKHWLDKVFEILGFVVDVEPPAPSGEGVKRPDYALFKDEDTFKEACAIKTDTGYFAKSLCIAEAKRYGRPLDRKLKTEKDPYEVQIPSLQINRYLWLSDVRFGILTDGKFFRLYERETSKKLDIFYEIDLEQVIASEDLEAFKYFYLFFGQSAFPHFLEKVYKGSIDYSQRVGKELEKNVYEALKILADGFLKNPPNNLTSARLDEIWANSLILLYRLLFILYAEYRNLLPLGKNQLYTQGYSFDVLKKEIASKIDQGISLGVSTCSYWDRLQELFSAINFGNEELSIPFYNGGLFNPEKHPFLEKYRVGDWYLARVIDLLTRAGDKAYIDYGSLDIRHLGSIYERLLEYKLKIADRDLVQVKEEFIPLTEVKKKVKDIISAGEVYLVPDKEERKVTGSYFTPDYIVQYIIENTLSQLIADKKEKAKTQAEKLMPKLKSLKQEIAGIKAQLTKAETPFQKKLYENELNKKEKHLQQVETEANPDSLLIDEILSIKLLDPAMGSGHFLVEATDFLAHALLKTLEGSLEESIYKETEIKEDLIPYEGVTKSIHEEEDIRWTRREIVEKCIFGVDLNPLAVELAKLSLWLHTVSKSRPLNFLDHHLRCGNSLIGAKVSDLGEFPLLKKKWFLCYSKLMKFRTSVFDN